MNTPPRSSRPRNKNLERKIDDFLFYIKAVLTFFCIYVVKPLWTLMGTIVLIFFGLVYKP